MAAFDADPRLRIGLTGGIASGKSLAADAFRRRGVPVLDADAAARAVTAIGSPGLAALVEHCGATLRVDGSLDRPALLTRLFRDPALRTQVEALLHPLIIAELAAAAPRAPGPYLVYAIPLLTESGLATEFHRILVVDCPEALQLQRLMVRDSTTEADARRMLAAQATRAARLALADEVLANDGSPEALDAAVGHLHETYLALSARPPSRPPDAGAG